MSGPTPIAFELQARFGPGEEWITLRVSSSPTPAVPTTLRRYDAWGRTPLATRVVPVQPRGS